MYPSLVVIILGLSTIPNSPSTGFLHPNFSRWFSFIFRCRFSMPFPHSSAPTAVAITLRSLMGIWTSLWTVWMLRPHIARDFSDFATLGSGCIKLCMLWLSVLRRARFSVLSFDARVWATEGVFILNERDIGG